MGKIRILDEDTISKISAGEVIDGPYSVVRELIDNSIDAGSTRIIINITEGGKKLIEVIDDGEGMDKEDLERCYLRHSTSKINSFEDLYNITTMGFRGEALGSIAEVSELEIVSKRRGEVEGYKLLVKGGKFESITPQPSQDGTTVRVRNLFFNLPPRRNFLKSETVEFRNVLDVVIKKAIPFPNIHFEFYHNFKKELVLPRVETLYERIISAYPEVKGLNNLKKTFEEINIDIFFSKPSINRPTRNLQQLYVNGRFVESKTFLTAVSNAYSNLVPKGSFPIVFCFIDIPPSLVDVNIHPAKKEIKFRNEGKVFHIITQTLMKGLSQSSQVLNIDETEFRFSDAEKRIKASLEEYLASSRRSSTEDIPFKPKEDRTFKQPTLPQDFSGTYRSESKTETPKITGTSKVLEDRPRHFEEVRRNIPASSNPVSHIELDVRFVGTVFETYLIFEDTKNDRLVLIDQHALHEKLIYSKLYREITEKNNISSQKLITPIEIEISNDCLQIIQEMKDVFIRLGFEFEIEGRKVIILSVPNFFGVEIDPVSSIVEICEKVKEGIEPNLETILETIASISCKKAIKSGDLITPLEAYKLYEDATKEEGSYACPHGRPTTIYVDRKTLETIFLRRG